MGKRLVIAAALVVVVAVIYARVRQRPGAGEWVEGSGVIEATEVDVSPLVGGRLTEVLVREGDSVAEGQTLARIDSEGLQALLLQAQGALQAAEGDLARADATLAGAGLSRQNAQTTYEKRTELKGRYEESVARYQAAAAARDQAKAQLDLLQSGTRAERLRQASAALRSAEAGWDDARRELSRLEGLVAEGAVSQRQLDRQHSAAKAARAGRDAARARLAELEAGARTQEERQAEAALAQAEANVTAAARARATAQELYADRLGLKQRLDVAEAEHRAAQQARVAAEGRLASARGGLAAAEKQMREATVRAPIAGVVVLRIRESGENVAPGQAVVRLADLDHMWLRVYVPETELARVKLQQEAEVRIDADPRKVFRGRVAEIAQEAEFTPKNVQTVAQRVSLVFGVKVEVENPERELKPGMPADARIKAGPSEGDG
jgi:multidrug resistance efflux pump